MNKCLLVIHGFDSFFIDTHFILIKLLNFILYKASLNM